MKTQDIEQLKRGPDGAFREAMRLLAKNFDRLSEMERKQKERYGSFLKRRLLKEWEKCRRLPPDRAWEALFPVMHKAFMEDESRFSIISLYWWLEGLKTTAESLGRMEEARLWEEMQVWIRKIQPRRISNV